NSLTSGRDRKKLNIIVKRINVRVKNREMIFLLMIKLYVDKKNDLTLDEKNNLTGEKILINVL
ncbi:MAG: hypothetical protein KAR14_02645, partial [Candidatus Aminicenantes bacterium]|nr:hypothetical protein [Candidatus Aminicenantes bacterium]